MATPAELTTLIRRETRTNTTTYPDAELLVDINRSIEFLASRIQTRRPEIFNLPATFNLELNNREYAFPTDVLNGIVTVEINLDGEGYKKCTGIKFAPEELNEDDIVRDYADTPAYFIRRKAVYFLTKAIPAVTEGGRIVYNVYPAPITDLTSTDDLSLNPTTTTLGFPREFHDLLVTKTSKTYKSINSMPLSIDEQSFDNDLENALAEFSTPDQSIEELINVPSGELMGGNGYNY